MNFSLKRCCFGDSTLRFFLSLSFSCGLSCYLYPLSLFFTLLWLLYLARVRKAYFLQGITLAALGWVYLFALYSAAPQKETCGPIEGIFSVQSVQPHSSPFHKDLLYKGILYLPIYRNNLKNRNFGKEAPQNLDSEEPPCQNSDSSSCCGIAVPCSIALFPTNRPLADQDYWVSGILFERGALQYTLKLQQYKPLAKKTWRAAEMRYQGKERLRKLLRKTLSPRSASTLASLVTGDVEDRLLRYEFSRAGLQHLLAISGFHFALLITFISGCLGLIFPRTVQIYFLLFALSLYFLFVGSAPAILRSFSSAILYFTGKLLRRHAAALNLLGASMLFELLIDPLALSQVGFQLSFVSCASLLLLFPLLDRAAQTYLPKRTIPELRQMTPLSSCGYIICALFRKSLCLTLAVNFTLFPLLLHHFHTFAGLGLIYNLFFPLAISLDLFFLLISLCLYALYHPLGQLCFWITDGWTTFLLELISYPPLCLNYSWSQNNVPGWIYPYYLFGIFCLVIYSRRRGPEFSVFI